MPIRPAVSLFTCLFVCLLLSWSTQVQARTYSYPDTRRPLFSLDIPNAWHVEIENDVLHAGPPDQSLYLGFWALRRWHDSVADAVEEVIDGLVENFQINNEDQIEVNGIPLYYIEGEGRYVEGGWINASIAIFSPDGKTFCVMLYFAAPEDEAYHERALINIVRSIRRGG